MTEGPSVLTRFVKKALFLGGLTLAFMAAALALWTKLDRREHRRAFRLAAPPGRAASPADLDRTAGVLTRRCAALRRALSVGRWAVRAMPPDRVEVTLSCRGDAAYPLAWITMQGRAEFRLVHPSAKAVVGEAPPDGYEVKVYKELRYVLVRLDELKTVEHPYLVQRDPVLAVDEFADADVRTVGAQKAVVITLTLKPSDAEALTSVTALHAGRDMALLIDGEMFFPPKRIEGAIAGGRLQAQGFFNVRAMRLLGAVLKCGSLPFALEEAQGPESRVRR